MAGELRLCDCPALPTPPPPAPGLQIRPLAQLTEPERDLLRTAGLLDRAEVAAWTVLGTNRQLAQGTHGIFRFFGKFPPPLAQHLIRTYTAAGEPVLDPMIGSGTTAVEALALGRPCLARDVSPLSLLLTRVKTTHLPRQGTQAALQRVQAAYQAQTAPKAQMSPEVLPRPVGLRNAEHWFLPETTAGLARLRQAIDAEPPGPVHDALQVALAATVRRVSRATTQQGRLFLDVATALPDVWPTFHERWQRLAEAVAALPERPLAELRLEAADARGVVPDRPLARLAIVHPPYFNNYKYSSINALELAWLGHPSAEVRKGEVREGFKAGKPEKAADYVSDLADVAQAVARQVQPDGTLALMMGDTTIRGTYLDVTARLLDEMVRRNLPLRLDKVVLRVPQYTEASWVASQRRRGGQVGVTLCDFVLILRRVP